MLNSLKDIFIKNTKVALGLALLAGCIAVLLKDQGLFWVPFALVGGVAWLGVLIPHWKWALYGLLLYLPFVGVPVVLFYPSPVPILLKDFLFVIPAYLGFFLENRYRKTLAFSAFPKTVVWSLLALAALVFLHLFNPASAGWLVGLVGLKVWLFYIPLYFLAYYLIDSKEQLFRLFQWMLVIALVPTAIGSAEAILLALGRTELVYPIYGAAAQSMFHDFRINILAGVELRRVPSTFTLVFQYFNYCLAMAAIAYAMWRVRFSQKPRRGYWELFVLSFVVLAGMLSGARAAFIFIPLYFVLAQIWDRGVLRLLMLGLALLVSLGLAMMILGGNLYATYQEMIKLTFGYYYVQLNEFTRALQLTYLGLGTGMNTGAARYVADLARIYGIENYYAKAVVEFGIPGLIVLVSLFLAILGSGWKNHNRLRDVELRAISSGILAYLALTMIYQWKGWFLDLDPVNVYFWFFAGLLARLPHLEETSAAAPGEPAIQPVQ